MIKMANVDINLILFKEEYFDFNNKFPETDTIKLIECVINIYVWWTCVQQTVSMGANCDPILADFLLYSNDAEWINGLLTKIEKKLVRSFNITFCYRHVDDALSLTTIPNVVIMLSASIPLNLI